MISSDKKVPPSPFLSSPYFVLVAPSQLGAFPPSFSFLSQHCHLSTSFVASFPSTVIGKLCFSNAAPTPLLSSPPQPPVTSMQLGLRLGLGAPPPKMCRLPSLLPPRGAIALLQCRHTASTDTWDQRWRWRRRWHDSD